MTNPLMFFRLLVAALLLCASAQQALAQKVLMLTTNEVATDAIVAYNNMETEFGDALPNPGDLTR